MSNDIEHMTAEDFIEYICILFVSGWDEELKRAVDARLRGEL